MSDVISMLMGEEFTEAMPFGENMSGNPINGYVQGEAVDYVPLTVMGNGVLGPVPQQSLEVWRDNRPLAMDELGREGPWVIPWVKISQPIEGKQFPLNLDFGQRFSKTLPGRAPQTEPNYMSPFPTVTWDSDQPIVEVLPSSESLYSTSGQGI